MKTENKKSCVGKVFKCCLSCQYAQSIDGKEMKCQKGDCKVSKYAKCNDYEKHSRYSVIGKSAGKLKERGYYAWRLRLIAKFSHGTYTDWDKYDNFVKSFCGNADKLYKYWKTNIKNNEKDDTGNYRLI